MRHTSPIDGNRGYFACLTYHIVGGQREDQYTVSGLMFGAQLAYLREEGYVTESLTQLEERLRGQNPFPARYAVLTLDDGHCSSMHAADMLAASGCGATFCVIRDKSEGGGDYVRPAQIRELRSAGFSIASHGVTHRKLSKLTRPECVRELTDSKTWLEDVLGEEVRHFAAPGGYFNSQTTELAFREGYTLFATCIEDMNCTDRLVLPGVLNRVNVRAHFSMDAFRSIVEGRRPFYWKRRARAVALTIPKLCLQGGA